MKYACCVQATKAQVTVVPRFDGWQAEVLQHMQKVFNSKGQPSFPRDLPDQLTAQASSLGVMVVLAHHQVFLYKPVVLLCAAARVLPTPRHPREGTEGHQGPDPPLCQENAAGS